MWLHRALPLAAAVWALAGCQADKPAGTVLQTLETTRDPRAAVQIPVTCTAVSAVCARSYAEHAASCLALVEAADAASRAAMRSCAQRDFRQSLAQSPPGSDRLVATRGLAEATRIARDNGPDYAASARELDGLSVQLRAMPGGAPYAAFYAADNGVSRVLTRGVPPGQACPALKEAEAELPAAGSAGDLGRNLGILRGNLAAAKQSRGCA